jgi:hypothetical protein
MEHNSLISEFDKINKSKRNDNDLLDFINSQLDEIAVKKQEFREQTRVAQFINDELLDKLTDDITNMLDNFGYKLEVIKNLSNDCYYLNIKFIGELDHNKRTECKTWYAEMHYASYEGAKGLSKSGFRLTAYYKSVVEFTNEGLLKDIARHIVYLRKRKV